MPAIACSERFPVQLTAAPAAAPFTARPSNTTCVAAELPLGRIRLEPTYTGFEAPVRMVDRIDRGLIYVGEMPGRVKVIDRVTGAVTTALDFTATAAKSGYGLLGLAVHPTKPYVYLTVERNPDATTPKDLPYRGEIVRFTSTDGGRTLDPASETLVIRIDRSGYFHFPGTLEFGPDGYLYVGVGESNAAVPWTPDKLTGSMLRLDVSGPAPYAIPPDNPFAVGGGRPEIWAGGFRNPWRFTFDRVTGELWEGDVGGSRFEEINKVERGKNYGWPTLEGTSCSLPREGCDPAGLAPPFFTYPHSEGGSITGGYVYRGKAMPDLVGKYIYGDFTVGHVRMLDGEGSAARAVFLNPGGPKPAISSFAEDADGELYALSLNDGVIYKLVHGDNVQQPVFPEKLSMTGCVDPANPKQVASGLVPYGLNVEFWSDGATKRRFIALPDGATMHVEDDGDFTLPPRSVVLKEFMVDGSRVETRLLRRHPNGEWSGATYEWNDAQTDASLLVNAKDKVLGNGQSWAFPSSVQCLLCHTTATGRTIGLETQQLNRDFMYVPGQIANQLTTLSALGFLDRPLDAAALPHLPALNGGAPLEDRARAYLHTNCSFCHRPDHETGVPMNFRFGLPRSAINGCTPMDFPGVADVKILKPGDPEHSGIYLQAGTRNDYQMPPLATRMVDREGLALLATWIRSVRTCE